MRILLTVLFCVAMAPVLLRGAPAGTNAPVAMDRKLEPVETVAATSNYVAAAVSSNAVSTALIAASRRTGDRGDVTFTGGDFAAEMARDMPEASPGFIPRRAGRLPAARDEGGWLARGDDDNAGASPAAERDEDLSPARIMTHRDRRREEEQSHGFRRRTEREER